MPEPVIHDTQRGLLEEEMTRYRKVYEAADTNKYLPRRPGEPLRAFAFDLDSDQIRTDMKAWPTFTEADRLRRVRLMVQFPDPVTGQRDLMYVVWAEANNSGSRDVAAVAFNALFPEKQKKGK